MKNIICSLLILIILLSCIPKTNAISNNNFDFNLNLNSNNNLSPSDIFEVSVSIKSSITKSIKNIKLSFIYDKDNLSIKKIQSINESCKVYSGSENEYTNIIINCKDFQPTLDVDIPLFVIYFKISKNPIFNENLIESYISGKLLEIRDIDNNIINNTNNTDNIKINIKKPEDPNCLLKSLIPSSGKLNPKFNPNVFDYKIDVDSETNTIEFDLETIDPEAYSKINRKRLGKAGSTTDITITVKSNKKGFKKIYNVSVNRAEKIIKTSTKTKPNKNKKDKPKKNSPSKTSSENNNNLVNKPEETPYTLIINENRFSSFVIGLITSIIISYIFLFKLRKISNNEHKPKHADNSN